MAGPTSPLTPLRAPLPHPEVKAADLRSNAALANALRPAVMRLARRLRQMRDDSLGLNANQLSAMAVLLNHGDLPMGELAAQEKMQPPSMTRIVNGLEERELVLRRADPRDRRQSLVSLTDTGRQVLLANRRRELPHQQVPGVEQDRHRRELVGREVQRLVAHLAQPAGQPHHGGPGAVGQPRDRPQVLVPPACLDRPLHECQPTV